MGDLMYLWSVKPLKLIRLLWQALARPQVSWLAFLLALLVPTSGQSQLVINEVMANNVTTLENGGLFPDWVELYNSGAAPLNLFGYTLTDSSNSPVKFAFPATNMPAFSRWVIWCDPTNSLGAGYHAGFSL